MNEVANANDSYSIDDQSHDYLRKVVSVPRNIPREVRENIAEIAFQEILMGKNYEIKDAKCFIREYGAFYLIFMEFKSTDTWGSIKQIAAQNEGIALICLNKALELIYDLIENYASHYSDMQTHLDEHVQQIAIAFEDIVKETMDLWNRNLHCANEEFTDELLEEIIDNVPNNSSDIQQTIVGLEDINQKKIVEFMDNESTNEFLNELIDQQISQPLSSLVDEIKGHLDSLELLNTIFPGRMWDYSLRELHNEYIQNLEKYASVVKNSQELKDIIETIGRIELEYGSKKISISTNGKSEMHSIHYSNNIEHMLPMEVMKLKNPVLKKKFYADLLENKLLSYQLRGKNWVSGPPIKKRKGPVVALVDTSGSMHGTPEILAKSVILAITKLMLKEKRDVKISLFSSVGQTIDIELTNKKKMAKEFLDFIQCSFGGGTDFNTALKSGLESLKEEKFKGADILFITDGLSSISNKSILEEWKSLKETQEARIYSLIVGNNNLGGLEEISDISYIVQNTSNWSINQSPANFVKYVSSNN